MLNQLSTKSRLSLEINQARAELCQAQVMLKLLLKMEIGEDNLFPVIFKIFLRVVGLVGGCGR